jgi:hypothetical protein
LAAACECECAWANPFPPKAAAWDPDEALALPPEPKNPPAIYQAQLYIMSEACEWVIVV